MKQEHSTVPKTGTKTNTPSKDVHISKCGKWRSFPKVPNLLQYVGTAVYFARVKVNGKTIRQSLKTDVFTTAKLKLPDFLKKEMTRKPISGTFDQAKAIYEAALESDHTISDNTKRYRKFCLKALAESWPELGTMPLAKITAENCQQWAKRFSAVKDEQYFNNTLGTLRSVLNLGGLENENPAKKIKRIGVKPTQIQLPEIEQFDKIVKEVE